MRLALLTRRMDFVKREAGLNFEAIFALHVYEGRKHLAKFNVDPDNFPEAAEIEAARTMTSFEATP